MCPPPLISRISQIRGSLRAASRSDDLDDVTFSFDMGVDMDEWLFGNGSDVQGTENSVDLRGRQGVKRNAPTRSRMDMLKGPDEQTSKGAKRSDFSSPGQTTSLSCVNIDLEHKVQTLQNKERKKTSDENNGYKNLGQHDTINGFSVNEPTEELPLEDVVYATGNENVGYGMTTAAQPSSFQSMKSLPQQQVAEERVWFANEGDASQQHLWSDKASSSIFIPTPSHPPMSPPISPSSQIPGVVEPAASWRTSPIQQELCWEKDICDRCRTSLDEIFTFLGSVDSEKQGTTGNCEDIDSGKLVGSTAADLSYLTNLPYFRRISMFLSQRNLTSKPKRSEDIVKEMGNAAGVDHSALEMTPEEARKHKEHTVAAGRVAEFQEESPIKCTEPRSLSSESRKPEKVLEIEGNTVEMDHSAPDLILKEAIQHSEHTVADQGEAHASKREKAFEKDISYEILSQHFGRPLDDARKSFSVSRTAFKKMCRDVGILRWKYGKRNMGSNPSKLGRRSNDEASSIRNFSLGISPVQDTPVVADTSHDSDKMTVKATYNGVPIRFNLPALSGMSELEDNVIKRLHLERNSFSIKYQDDEGEWVLIACDEDVRECMEFSRSLQKTTIKMRLDPPVDHCAA